MSLMTCHEADAGQKRVPFRPRETVSLTIVTPISSRPPTYIGVMKGNRLPRAPSFAHGCQGRCSEMVHFSQSESPCQLILWLASGVPNGGGSSPLLVPLPAVSWPWVPAWGSLEPPRRDGENAQKTGENGEKMSEIWPKKCEQGKDRTDHLPGAQARGGSPSSSSHCETPA